MYSIPGHIIDACEVICGTYIGIMSPLIYIESFEHEAYILLFEGHIYFWQINSNNMVRLGDPLWCSGLRCSSGK